MGVRIGNQTARSARRPAEPFEYAVQNDFDAFEWFMDSDGPGPGWQGQCPESREAREEIGRRARVHGMILSLHAPRWIDPFRLEDREIFLWIKGVAEEMGVLILNLHIVLDRGIKALAEALAPLLLDLVDGALQASIENTPGAGPEEFNELFARLVDLEPRLHGHVGMCLDLGHANLCPQTKNDYLGYLDRLGSHVPINHIHLHENYGDGDSHLTLFTGPSAVDPSGIQGFVERMKGRGYCGSIILEQWPDPPNLLNEARDRLVRMFAVKPETTRLAR